MKRRSEEVVKTENSGGYPPSPHSPPHLTARAMTSVPGVVVQPTYSPTIKPTTDLRGVQTFPIQTSFTNTMTTVTPAMKAHSGSMTPPNTNVQSSTQQQIQRLKVEDALSYLDLVKFKFGEKPQVYNDFLDIMKEFKSQSIDTPGVIDRVSNLFNGHPELIVGFNTFLPPGYKIEVKANDQGYSFQVQVSMPSTSPGTTSLVPTTPPLHHSTVIPSVPISSVVVSSPKPLLMSSSIVQHAAAVSTVIPSSSVPAPTLPVPTPAVTPPTYHPLSVQPSTSGIQPQSIVHVETTIQQSTPQNQPVEFNHAINYVNKIKNRFQLQPDKYKKFLEILHTYQKEQRNIKDGICPSSHSTSGTKQLTEAEVYSQVAKLFEHQEDLLAEFGQFLPDATSHQANLTRKCEELASMQRKPQVGLKLSSYNSGSSTASANSSPVPVSSSSTSKLANPVASSSTRQETAQTSGVKRSPPFPSQSHHLPTNSTQHHRQSKKHKFPPHSYKDVSLADAGKYGTLNEFAFFDKVRRALRNQEVYDNFLRCLVLFNEEIVSKIELIQVVTPFLGRFPELFRWFKEFLGMTESPPIHLPGSSSSSAGVGSARYDSIINNVARQERPQGDQAMSIDFSSCKRLGASYCALPKTYVPPPCSGRTPLCREVLNDTWVSFPTWSEESTFVTSRKTTYEEYIYRCEDERFELDVVIETNLATIRVLEGVHKKLCRLSTEEVAKFVLDDCLGGTSPTIHQSALYRIYGEKAADIIDGLKRNPVVAVPVVLRRLKAKEEEWREAQKGFNKIWREQNEKYYLKSLDHQGINFKPTDIKALRSKSLFNEIETCYDERHEQAESNGETAVGPHLVLPYKDRSVLDDAANLLIHHVKRQTSVHKEDKQRVKQLIRQFLPDLFHHPRQELSEDEREDADEKMSAEPSSPGTTDNVVKENRRKSKDDGSEEENKTPIHAVTTFPDEVYTLFFGNGNWYLFLRLHHILCDRLYRMYEQAGILAKEEAKNKINRKESTAIALRLKMRTELDVNNYYPTFLDMVKNVLDGNMDINTYEDTLREMFGIHAYISFTLDKVVSNAVRQLQHLVADESCTQCADMYLKENRRGGAGGLCATAFQRAGLEMNYQRKAEAALSDENCFKIFIYKRDCKMTIELLDTDGEDPEPPVRDVAKWTTYVDRFAQSHSKDNLEHLMEVDEEDLERERSLWKKAIFLPRNIRLWQEKVGNDKSKLPKIDSCDETECRFNLNSYKMVFVINRENYLYKKNALGNARQSHKAVTKKLGVKFHVWYNIWASKNVSKQQQETARDWLMGKAPDTVPNVTFCRTDNALTKPPYRSYNRFKVRRIKQEK